MNEPDTPVFHELQRQVSDDSPLANATALWLAAGRPRNWSPRRFFDSDEIAYDAGGGADAAVLVDHGDATRYAACLDDETNDWVAAKFFSSLRADPTRHILGCPNSIMGAFATSAVMRNEGVDQTEAAGQLVAEAVERTEGLDAYQQETAVARVQRAVRGEPGPDDQPRRQGRAGR